MRSRNQPSSTISNYNNNNNSSSFNNNNSSSIMNQNRSSGGGGGGGASNRITETSFTTTDRLIKLEIECQTLREENDVLKFHLSSLMLENQQQQSGNNNNNDGGGGGKQQQQELFSALSDKNQKLEEQNSALVQQLALLETEAKVTSQSFSDLMREHDALVDAIDNNSININLSSSHNHNHNNSNSSNINNNNDRQFQQLQENHKKVLAQLEQEQTARAQLQQQLQAATTEAERHRVSWDHSRRTAEDRSTKLRECEKKLQEANNFIQQLQNEIRDHVCKPPPPDPREEELKQRRREMEEEEKQQERTRWERRIANDYVPVESYAELEAVCRSLRDEINHSGSEVDRLKEQASRANDERAHFKKEWEYAASRVTTLTTDSTVLREQTIGLRERLRQTQDDFDVFRSHMGRVTQQRDMQAKEIQQLRNEIFQLRKVSSANQALVTAAWRSMPTNNNNNNSNPPPIPQAVSVNENSRQSQNEAADPPVATKDESNSAVPENLQQPATASSSDVPLNQNNNTTSAANLAPSSSSEQQPRRASSAASISSSITNNNTNNNTKRPSSTTTTAASKMTISSANKQTSTKAQQMAKQLLSAALGGGTSNSNNSRSSSIHNNNNSRSGGGGLNRTPTKQNANNRDDLSSLRVSPQTPRPSSSSSASKTSGMRF